MRTWFLTFVIGLFALSQHALAQNATFIAELLDRLSANGLTSLATAALTINGTETGRRLFSQLGEGPQTIFAPVNTAFNGVPSNISSNPELLAQVLSYHVLPGRFNLSDTPSFPNTTVARTLFNSSDLVFLEGNRSQVLAWTNQSDGSGVHILNQNTNVRVLNSTTIGDDLTVHIVNSVIDVPGELTAALQYWNLTAARSVLEAAGLLNPLNYIHGFTFFAPTDSAFAAAQSQLTQLSSNETAIRNVLLNHVVNGTSIYTGNLIGASSENSTSAAGEGIGATFNSSGGFINSGTSTARIVQPDVVLWNGVLHIVDRVLINTEGNQRAAESAASSASDAATSTPTETGPIGFTPSPAGASSAALRTSISPKCPLMLVTVLGGLFGFSLVL